MIIDVFIDVLSVYLLKFLPHFFKWGYRKLDILFLETWPIFLRPKRAAATWKNMLILCYKKGIQYPVSFQGYY